MNQEQVLNLKKSYLPSTRIQMSIPNDSEADSQPYKKGTVDYVDDAGQVHITMDSGEVLIVDPEASELKRLSVDDQILEAEAIRNEQLGNKHRQRDRSQNEQDREGRE